MSPSSELKSLKLEIVFFSEALIPSSPHKVTALNTNSNIFIAVRTSGLRNIAILMEPKNSLQCLQRPAESVSL